ncbi:hypothetical protein [Amphibacillus cookii]|uniref:hypothetical protein n=1 Tax=Amphibacillus cookii TaxID=767787 RepID=UPI00195B1F8D|nr:hypothetical protein [Amphibacillus cookii]MBM7542798.1 CBS domain containing-hemolysin-like protein [Amphibacillus cookii]
MLTEGLITVNDVFEVIFPTPEETTEIIFEQDQADEPLSDLVTIMKANPGQLELA